MKQRDFITLLGGAAAWPLAARAQQLKVAQIGVLVLTNADGQSLTRELRLGLRDLGYSEGQNFVFQLRSSDGDVARLPQLATELVNSQVDVIVATFTPCALAAWPLHRRGDRLSEVDEVVHTVKSLTETASTLRTLPGARNVI